VLWYSLTKTIPLSLYVRKGNTRRMESGSEQTVDKKAAMELDDEERAIGNVQMGIAVLKAQRIGHPKGARLPRMRAGFSFAVSRK
jgi:hypothetical protein